MKHCLPVGATAWSIRNTVPYAEHPIDCFHCKHLTEVCFILLLMSFSALLLHFITYKI